MGIVGRTVALAVISAILLSNPTSALAAGSLERQAWRDACRLSGYSCYGIKMPKVTYLGYLNDSGTYGIYYLGADVVYVASNLVPGLQRAVTAHEMTHYLQAKVGNMEGGGFASCLMEAEAFQVSDAVLSEYPELVDLKRNGDLTGYAGCAN